MAQRRRSDIISANFAAEKQTFIIPLTFTDISDAKDTITRIGYGGDVWELRADLLSPNGPLTGEVNLPPPEYVRNQIRTLQSLSGLPVLFTIRTKSQGGKFPDGAAKEALELMLLAVQEGIDYIDVEIGWPPETLEAISARKEQTLIVASYHSWTGLIRWSSRELADKFAAADTFGDIIKLSILSSGLEDCYELGLFVKDYRQTHQKPLLAVGMGANGQLSRITSPISLVTHPLIPFPSAPGQLSLAQVNVARYLIGQLPKLQIVVSGEKSPASNVKRGLQAAIIELGYPHEVTMMTANSPNKIIHVSSVETKAEVVAIVCREFTNITSRPPPLLVIQGAMDSDS